MLKVLVPPSWKTWRSLSNWHTSNNIFLTPKMKDYVNFFPPATLVFSRGENPANHLHLGRQLSRLMAHACSCEAGLRTNSACRHINASVTAVCSPNSFRTTKKMDARLTDLNRPDGHQPNESGPPAVPPILGQQPTVPCQRPSQRVSRDSRGPQSAATSAGFHNLAPSPDPHFRARFRADLSVHMNRGARDRAADALQGGGARGRRRNRNGQGHPSTLGRMRNTGRSERIDINDLYSSHSQASLAMLQQSFKGRCTLDLTCSLLNLRTCLLCKQTFTMCFQLCVGRGVTPKMDQYVQPPC